MPAVPSHPAPIAPNHTAIASYQSQSVVYCFRSLSCLLLPRTEPLLHKLLPDASFFLRSDRQMASVGKMAAVEDEGQQLGLCDLPDEILIRIMSMLPTEDAVRTCLLVLRRSGQHHLWKSLTSLSFHALTTMFSLKSNFINFVDRVMYLRDHSVPLVSFSLQTKMKHEGDANRIETWITKAVQCNVEELTLSIHDVDVDVEMSNTPYCCIFGCQSLVKLDLDDITFNVPSSVICLPRLKYLRVTYVLFSDDESTEKLLSSPLLEELILYKCTWYGIGSISVCSPKLQVLKIYDDDDDDDDDDEDDDDDDYYDDSAKICIIGDSLKYFSYEGNLINEFQICASSFTQLSKVEIYVNEEIPEKYALNCYNILKGLCGTPNLALSDYFIEGLQNSSELLDIIPIFERLTRLDIRVYKKAICVDSLVLMKIYERCPHLEYLNIGKLSHTVRSPQLNPIPLCFWTHLKKVVANYYVTGEEDDAALDVFLNNALVLEELVIYCKWDRDNDLFEGGCKIQKLQDRINRRPKASKDCIISVRWIFKGLPL